MKKLNAVLVFLAVVTNSQAYAEVTTRVGSSVGVVMGIKVDAAVGTEVQLWKAGADPEGEHMPFNIGGEWTFTWDSNKDDVVNFTGVLNYGDHFTMTNAGWMGGVSTQTFFDFAHHIEGTANWENATRKLTFKMIPKARDDGRASSVTQAKPPTCEPKGKACSAFEKNSSPIEGLSIRMIFNEDLSRFEGTVIAIQYGGSGFTKSQSDTTMKISGDLAAQQDE